MKTRKSTFKVHKNNEVIILKETPPSQHLVRDYTAPAVVNGSITITARIIGAHSGWPVPDDRAIDCCKV